LLNSGTANFMRITHLERSDDAGMTWQAADADLGNPVLYQPYPLGDADTLLANVNDTPAASSRHSTLWITHDAGRHWSPIGPNSGDTALITAPNRNTPDALHLWYTLQGEQFSQVTIFQTTDGISWKQLPLLPLPSNTPQTFPNVQKVIAELPDGRLVVLGGDPATPPNSGPVPSRNMNWLWIWNPQTAIWSAIDSPIAANSNACGPCRQTAITLLKTSAYIWVDDLSSQPRGLYRILIPLPTLHFVAPP